jgi:hypothetical protein
MVLDNAATHLKSKRGMTYLRYNIAFPVGYHFPATAMLIFTKGFLVFRQAGKLLRLRGTCLVITLPHNYFIIP